MLPSVPGPDPATTPPDALWAAWMDHLRDGSDGDSRPEALSLERAGELLAAKHHLLDSVAATDELRDRLVVDMITAVIDVETLAARLPLDLSPEALRARIEGDAPMTLYEYAHVRHALANA